MEARYFNVSSARADNSLLEVAGGVDVKGVGNIESPGNPGESSFLARI